MHNHKRSGVAQSKLRIRKHPGMAYHVLEVNGVIVDWTKKSNPIDILTNRAKELGYKTQDIFIVKENVVNA